MNVLEWLAKEGASTKTLMSAKKVWDWEVNDPEKGWIEDEKEN
tara:strand:- start:750 stop:878 length:129 start_codon:yes stop_codon:yes gene_type:complete